MNLGKKNFQNHSFELERPSIGIILVLFYPDIQHVLSIIKDLINPSASIVVVDNTPNSSNTELVVLAAIEENRLEYIPLKSNKGIATAQNIGIKKAQEIGNIDYILFLDQDSQLKPGFSQKMVEEYNKILLERGTLAAVGPTPLNINTGKIYKQEKLQSFNDVENYLQSSFLISSGMIMKMETLLEVGFMEEKLFIDIVDFEWCWRAKSKDLNCFITKNVVMNHKVGVSERSFLGHPILISSPIRYYFQYRNYFLLLNRHYIPLSWKISNGIRKIFYLVYFPLFIPKGKNIFKYMINGIIDGVFKKI